MIYTVSIWLLPVLIAVTFHEAAHGFVARFLGDETASRLGRLSLNPLRHIDPFGTILLPGLLLRLRLYEVVTPNMIAPFRSQPDAGSVIRASL